MTTTDRSTKNQTLYFSVPCAFTARIDAAAKARGITKSALFREMFQAWDSADRKSGLDGGGQAREPGKDAGGSE